MTKPRASTVTDPADAKRAAEAEAAAREQRLRDIRQIMTTEEGRRYLLGKLVEDRVFSSLWHPTGSEVYRRIGRHEKGLAQFAEIAEAFDAGGDPRVLVDFLVEGIRQGKDRDHA